MILGTVLGHVEVVPSRPNEMVARTARMAPARTAPERSQIGEPARTARTPERQKDNSLPITASIDMTMN